MNRLPRVFTWHVHGNYLWYLSQARAEFFLPVRAGGGAGYGGRGSTFPFGPNVHEIAAEDVRATEFDCVLYQAHGHYREDRYSLLSEAQRSLPAIVLEHDPPRGSPTDTLHPAAGDDVLLVHVTAFNALMWDSGAARTRVIEHGVIVPPEVRYSGELARGLVVVNNLHRRGRRLGADIYETLRRQAPLDLVGMGAAEHGGLGEIAPTQLAAVAARYRFFLNPIRYTSLGLAVCEAMMIGLPVLGLATTELVTVVENGVSGYLETDPGRLVGHMQRLLADPAEARRLGEGARRTAQRRFGIERFARDWERVFAEETGIAPGAAPAPADAVGGRL